jgi:uncharacterized protein
MSRPDALTRPAAWVGTLARLIAFAALTAVFMAAFVAASGLLSAALPPPSAQGQVLIGSTLLALAALAAGAVLIRAADGRAPRALGIGLSRHTPRHAGIGLAIGAAGILAATVLLLAAGSVRFSGAPGTVGGWATAVSAQAAVFTMAALAEEALFRGYAFQVLARATGPVPATVVSSGLFAAAHGANPDVGVVALINIFLAGILLAVAYLRTLSLWFATAVHLGWNWTMATLLDLPVSGIDLFDTPLYDASLSGPVWWSGGGFGPEGGLVGTLGFAVALLLVLRLRQVRPDPRIALARPLVLDRERGTS